jgi:epoxide hydrolase 4
MSAAREARGEMIRHEFADVNGVRIHYAIACPAAAGEARGVREAERKLIVFLHGFPEFWYAWRRQLEEFGREYVAVAPDMRGYNLSSKPAEIHEYEIGKLVGDVHALVEHLSAKHGLRGRKCFLVGHDWGGAVAWAVAIAAPEIVEKLVIINAPHPKIFERELTENPAQQ